MRIAIPLYKDRVAPHFGIALKVLLIEIQGDAAVEKIRCDIARVGAMEMARKLFEMGISTLICGGIETYFKDWLTRKGVTVLDNQMGSAREVIAKYLGARPLSKGWDG